MKPTTEYWLCLVGAFLLLVGAVFLGLVVVPAILNLGTC